MFDPHKEHQEVFARGRLLRILQVRCGVVAGIAANGRKRGIRGKELAEIAPHCGYFETRQSDAL